MARGVILEEVQLSAIGRGHIQQQGGVVLLEDRAEHLTVDLGPCIDEAELRKKP